MHLYHFLAAATAFISVGSALIIPRRNETAVTPLEAIASFDPIDALAQLAANGLKNIEEIQANGIASRGSSCSLFNVAIRRDWYVNIISLRRRLD